MLNILNTIKDWVINKSTELGSDMVVGVIGGTGNLIVSLEGVLIIIAIIGIYLVIANNKQLGTKLTSMSIFIYVLGKVLASVH